MATSYWHNSQCSVSKSCYTRQIENSNEKKATRTLAIYSHLPSRKHASATARMVIELVDEYEWSVLEDPRHSPDFAPHHIWLFPKIKEHLRGYRFDSEEDTFFRDKGSHLAAGQRLLRYRLLQLVTEDAK
ncbi:histone-lysine N-methyltransferase SETMAR [Plakobranchus ocellatus]|uniref:Histone-lysine N-methyltransferase SETMAR n=1 Tax=Plakobranchus ocellatus TaxID=259542 RepID=A0AAV3YZ92_9GAST|nr:histone-lysine N-methyltransferase SETMAR [Plakobranchus ocellatus]